MVGLEELVRSMAVGMQQPLKDGRVATYMKDDAGKIVDVGTAVEANSLDEPIFRRRCEANPQDAATEAKTMWEQIKHLEELVVGPSWEFPQRSQVVASV